MYCKLTDKHTNTLMLARRASLSIFLLLAILSIILGETSSLLLWKQSSSAGQLMQHTYISKNCFWITMGTY